MCSLHFIRINSIAITLCRCCCEYLTKIQRSGNDVMLHYFPAFTMVCAHLHGTTGRFTETVILKPNIICTTPPYNFPSPSFRAACPKFSSMVRASKHHQSFFTVAGYCISVGSPTMANMGGGIQQYNSIPSPCTILPLASSTRSSRIYQCRRVMCGCLQSAAMTIHWLHRFYQPVELFHYFPALVLRIFPPPVDSGLRCGRWNY